MKYALVGHGRMGRAVDAVASSRGHTRTALVDAPIHGEAGWARLGEADVAFEFTVGESAERNVCALLAIGVPVICGTTGWSPSEALGRAVREASAGLVLAPNFSIGMNLFFRLVAHAGRLLGPPGLHESFIHETHHRGKRDVPSGTARRLAAILVEADPRWTTVVEGHPLEPLPPGAVHVTGSRAGAEPGTHRVAFDGAHELIALEHRARGREGFALGAVLAAEWLGRRRGAHPFDAVVDALLAQRGPAWSRREGDDP
jgi:4-hydroxy-tetrahydrodipicolinate reductase